MSAPFDKKSSFFSDYFKKAKSYKDFIQASDPNHQKKWANFQQVTTLAQPHIDLLKTFKRKMHVLCLAGSWCGDCARQCPILNAIAEVTPNFELRLIDNHDHPELADEVRIHGASRVPTVILLSEDFLEVSRFGDRTLAAYRRKAAQELGPACDAGLVPPTPEELALEIKDWVEYFERGQILLRLSPYLRSRYND